MKLRNKLLPLTGIAAIAATVTPLGLTSCSKKIELVDLTDGSQAVPTVEKAKSDTSLTQSEATKLYIDNVNNNSEIFKQDFLYGMWANYKLGYTHELSDTAIRTINSLKAGCTTPTFGKTSISYPGEPDVIYDTISFSYTIQANVSDESLDLSSSYPYSRMDYNTSLSVTIKDIPIMASAFADTRSTEFGKQWWISLPNIQFYNYIWQYNTNSWSFDYSITEQNTRTWANSTGFHTETKDRAEAKTISTFRDLPESGFDFDELDFGFVSYHLSNISQSPELVNHNSHYGQSEHQTEEYYKAITATVDAQVASLPSGTGVGLYMPYSQYKQYNPTVALCSEYKDEGEGVIKPTAPIVLKQEVAEGETAQYLQIPSEACKFGNSIQYTDGSYYAPLMFPTATIWKDSACTEGNDGYLTSSTEGIKEFNFRLPKSIYAILTVNKYSWVQQIWLSQDLLNVYINFQTA